MGGGGGEGGGWDYDDTNSWPFGSEKTVPDKPRATLQSDFKKATIAPKRPSRMMTHLEDLQGSGMYLTQEFDSWVQEGLRKGSLTTNGLILAVADGDTPMVEYFINDFQNYLDATNYQGWSPLMVACAHGHTKIANMLLDTLMVDRNRQDNQGLTALHYAVHAGHTKTVETLLNREVDFTLEASSGETALDMAAHDQDMHDVFLNHKRVKRHLHQAEILEKMRGAQKIIMAPKIEKTEELDRFDPDQPVYDPKPDLLDETVKTITGSTLLHTIHLAIGEDDRKEKTLSILKEHMKYSEGARLGLAYNAAEPLFTHDDWAEIFVYAASENALHVLEFLNDKESFFRDKNVMDRAMAATSSSVVYRALETWQENREHLKNTFPAAGGFSTPKS